MKRPVALTLAVTLTLGIIILATQAAHNRKLAARLAEREAAAGPKPGSATPSRASLPGNLSMDALIARIQTTPPSPELTQLLELAAQQDPRRALDLLPRPVITGHCLQCHDQSPPEPGSCRRYDDNMGYDEFQEGWNIAKSIFLADPEQGLRAFVEMQKRDYTKIQRLEPTLEKFALPGTMPLGDDHLSTMAAALENPDFDPIRADIIKHTLYDALYEGGVAAMAERQKTLSLTEDDLDLYIKSVISLDDRFSSALSPDILSAEPEATLQWVAEVSNQSEQKKLIPDMVLCWAHRDAKAAFGWVGEQAPSPVRDATIARLVTKGTNLDQASAEAWAREIQDQVLRERTLQELLKAGR